jgi:hypothetical protein
LVGLTGVTTIDCSGFLLTVSVVELVTEPNVAVIVTVPN